MIRPTSARPRGQGRLHHGDLNVRSAVFWIHMTTTSLSITLKPVCKDRRDLSLPKEGMRWSITWAKYMIYTPSPRVKQLQWSGSTPWRSKLGLVASAVRSSSLSMTVWAILLHTISSVVTPLMTGMPPMLFKAFSDSQAWSKLGKTNWHHCRLGKSMTWLGKETLLQDYSRILK